MRQELVQKTFDLNLILNDQMQRNDIDECLIDEMQDMGAQLTEDEYIAVKALTESLNKTVNIPGVLIFNN